MVSEPLKFPHLTDQLSGGVGKSRHVRRALAFVSLLAIATFWWQAASDKSVNKIFGIYSMRAFSTLVIISYILLWCIYVLIGRDTVARKVARAVLTTITLIVLGFFLELPAALNLIDYRRVISPPQSFLLTNVKPWDSPGNVLDDELIYIRRPHQTIGGEASGDLVNWLGISTRQRYHVNITYDSHGFRNDHDIDKASLALIGDSFVEGVLVPHQKLVSTQLSNAFGVEVANLGQSGYGPQQELIVLRRFGVKLSPKVVVWMFFEGNDLLDVARYEGLIANRKQILHDRNSLFQRSFLRNVLYTLAGYTAPRVNKDTGEARRRSGQLKQTGETIYFAYAGTDLSQEELSSLKTTQDCLLKAQSISEESGAKLLLAYVPTKYRVYRDLCDFPQDGYGRTWKLNNLPSQFESWSKEHGIAFIDLTSALRKSAADGELVYFPDDGHWNSNGQTVVAQTLEKLIRAAGWLTAK